MARKSREGLTEFLGLPLYTYTDADHLARTSHGTAKRWLTGYQYVSTSSQIMRQPPVTPRASTEPMAGASFLDLVELVAIGGLKDLGFTLQSIRKIVENCQELLDVQRPLTSLKFKTDGREIFISDHGELLEVLGKKGQRAWDDVLANFLETLDYENNLARRWWPLGKRTPILIDPDYGFGFPVIRGSGVRTDIILERFQADDSHDDLREIIASDFNVTTRDVDAAIKFEMSRLKRAA